jgi:quercetin dioxygenase-like cupin family protein
MAPAGVVLTNHYSQEMIVRNYSDVPAAPVEGGATKTTIRELITVREGAPNFAMRLFELQPGGHTPLHSHAWEHEVFIVEGAGAVNGDQAPRPFRAGDSVFIPGDEKHQFANGGPGLLRFICVIPLQNPCDV